jgi:cell division septal protein FtsQ
MRTTIVRSLLVTAAALVLLVATAFAPIGLRGLRAFRVQHVQVDGVVFLPPHAAVQAAGITGKSSVFDDPTPWLDNLRMHPLVADVRIQRRLPGTLVLHVREAVPIAFARTPELRAIGSNGRILPADPAHHDLDMPVLTVTTRVSAQGRAVDRETLDIVRFLELTRATEPQLLDWVSEIGVHAGAIRLVLRSDTDADVLIPVEPAVARLRELAATLAELSAPRVVVAEDGSSKRAADTDLSRVKRIDVRYQDQIVVSMRKGKS